MMGPYVAAKNLVRKRITLTPVTGGRKSNEVGIAAFDQPPAVCFGPRPCPADIGKARPNVHGCGVGHRRLRKVCRELGRGCAIVQGGRPQRPVAKHVGSNPADPSARYSRQVKTAAYTKTLPGAPAGEYVVIQYDSSFEHQPAAIATSQLGRGWAGESLRLLHSVGDPRSSPGRDSSSIDSRRSLAIWVTVYKPFTSIDGPARISLFS
jgi:hypothetical protein